MKGYTSESPSPWRERGEDPCCKGPAAIQSTCHCVGVHPGLLLCRNQSCSLRVLGHAADPLVVLRLDIWLDRCAARATIITGCGPLPFIPKHSMAVLSFSPTQCCSLLKNTCRPTILQFSLSFVLSLFFSLHAYFSLEHPHYSHSYILRASLFDFGLVGNVQWAGESCRAGPALRAPQPASRRVGLGVLFGWAPLQKHWRYCQSRRCMRREN